jgi:hypothetical protein
VPDNGAKTTEEEEEEEEEEGTKGDEKKEVEDQSCIGKSVTQGDPVGDDTQRSLCGTRPWCYYTTR